MFTRWLLGASIVALAAVMSFNWWVDPTGNVGRQTTFAVAENGEVRQVKLDLMDELEEAPDVLVLGSSRSMKLDPRDIRAVTGVDGFNAGVSGGTNRDFRLYGAYAAELWPERSGSGGPRAFPHLVVGIANDTFRSDESLGRVLDRRLLPYLADETERRQRIATFGELARLETLRLSVRLLQRRVCDDGWAVLRDPTAPVGREEQLGIGAGEAQRLRDLTRNRRRSYTPRGMQLFDPANPRKASLERRVEVQMRNYIDLSFERADDAFTGTSDGGERDLRRLIRLANDRGDVPTLWLTPFQPSARRMLPTRFADRDARFREAMERLQKDGSLQFEVVDFTSLAEFGGTARDWYDGIHMDEANTRRIVAELHRRGLLAPEQARSN